MTNNPTIALTMIAKDKESIIERALDSTKGVFDFYILQDTGSTDKTLEVFEAWCKAHDKKFKTSKKYVGKDYRAVEVNGKQILGEFNKPRQETFDMARELGAEYAFWLDTDDVIVGAENILNVVKQMVKNNVAIAIMKYNYAPVKGNLSPVIQERERIIDLKIPGKWKNWVHENYQVEGNVGIVRVQNIVIQHLRTGFESAETGRRNNLIMQSQIKEEGVDSFDDGMLNNLAFDHWEHREYEESIKYYQILLDRPTPKPAEHLYHILIKMTVAYQGLAQLEQALVFANRAIKLNDALPDGYLMLAEIYSAIGNHKLAEEFADKVLKIGKPETTAPINEMDYSIVPLRIKMVAAVTRGDFMVAMGLIEQMIALMPSEQFEKERIDMEKNLITNDAVTGIHKILSYMQANNLMKDADRLIQAIPLLLKDNPTVRQLIAEAIFDFRRKSEKIKFNGPKTIYIYAGYHYEEWDGNSDIERGIGGSEGMTIIMARNLAKLGNKVTVFGEVSEKRIIDGVTYLPYTLWNPDLRADIFISLRQPQIFSRLLMPKKQYLWLHDTNYGRQNPSYFNVPDNVMVLSEAHKAVIKSSHGINDDSVFWLTRNAINEKAMEWADKNAGERKPFQMIYASSYDRGLDNVLNMWPKIKAVIPEATLKIYYGWNTYDAMMQMRQGTPQGQAMFQLKQQIIQKIAQLDGVQELGRIDQKSLYKEFAESAVWFYPTEFYEISCINAMTAQAMGAIPVCTPYAALNETVNTKYGVKLQLDKIADGLVELLKDPEDCKKRSVELKKWAREKFDPVTLAKEWDTKFNNG